MRPVHTPRHRHPAPVPPRRARARLGSLVSLLLSLLPGMGLPAQGQMAPRVPTMRLQLANTSASVQWEGLIQPLRQSTVASQVTGNITALLVKAGDAVKAGQVLARIDEREPQAGLNRSQADVAQAEALLSNARQQWERIQQLKAQGFISAAALDSAQTQWRAAQASLAAAQAARTQAALTKGFATVTAPFDGRVLATQAEVGDLAVPGRTIATLYAPQALRAVVQVPASQSKQVDAAKVIEVLIPQGGHREAVQTLRPIKVAALPGADPVSQTVEWRLDLPPLDAMPGQTVQVRFSGFPDASASPTPGAQSTGQAGGLLVPARAVLQRGELTAVYVVREGQFMLQAVRTGPTPPHAAAVTLLSGVKPGDVIAADAIQAGLANAPPAQP
jgi:RND family efflux transporter MFP subunit